MTTVPPVIGMGGLLASGKDAFADRLVERHGFTKIGMSDALHNAMLAENPLVGLLITAEKIWPTPVRYAELVEIVGYVEAKKSPEVRGLLQRLGTEVGRNMIGTNTWADITARNVEALRDAGKPVVVTGIRFPNELEMIDMVGGTALWVHRPSAAPAAAATAPSPLPPGMVELRTHRGESIWVITATLPSPVVHASENSVSATDFSGIIDNSGTLEDLYARADEYAARGRLAPYCAAHPNGTLDPCHACAQARGVLSV